MVLLVLSQVVRQVSYPFRHKRYLNLGGPGIILAKAKILDDLVFSHFFHLHNCCQLCPLGSVEHQGPRLGFPARLGV